MEWSSNSRSLRADSPAFIRANHVYLLAIALLSAVASDASAQTPQLARFEVSLRDNLDEWYQPEYERLGRLCKQDAECWRREIKPREWIQAPVYGRPDSSSPPIVSRRSRRRTGSSC